jgi:hypothetical protein
MAKLKNIVLKIMPNIRLRNFAAMNETLNFYFTVLPIRIWIHRIHMFLGLLDPDPDPSVRGMDPDPSSTKQN